MQFSSPPGTHSSCLLQSVHLSSPSIWSKHVGTHHSHPEWSHRLLSDCGFGLLFADVCRAGLSGHHTWLNSGAVSLAKAQCPFHWVKLRACLPIRKQKQYPSVDSLEGPNCVFQAVIEIPAPDVRFLALLHF